MSQSVSDVVGQLKSSPAFISSEHWLIYEQNFIKIGGISLLILAGAVENGL